MLHSGQHGYRALADGLREVLETSAVRQRIIEYLGGNTLAEATCLCLGRLDPLNPSRFERHPPHHLHSLLSEGCELARSLEDRDSMLIHLDVEYVNFDDPTAAYRDPARTFHLQQPLVEIIESHLLELGIRYLHIVTGQGHHFVWRIRRDSPLAQAIRNLTICNAPEARHTGDPLFNHVALLMEFLAHRIKQEAAASCAIPVELTALHVGPGRYGTREILSIDLSEYGDPLASRMIRIPYTVYRKPWVSGLLDSHGVSHQIPEFFTLPLHEMDIQQLIEGRHHPPTVLKLARRAGTTIPCEERGTWHLLEQYQASNLVSFHREYYAVPHTPSPPTAAEVARRLPPCVRHVIDTPNDWLLKPTGMQLVTRCLLADGWPPRHIASFIAAIFQDNSREWGDRWRDYHPTLRADFYVRLFAGQIQPGIDQGVDFNCQSQQEKHFCWNPNNCSLEPYHSRIYRALKP